eukprot:2453655-Rhodomonas_salina.1
MSRTDIDMDFARVLAAHADAVAEASSYRVSRPRSCERGLASEMEIGEEAILSKSVTVQVSVHGRFCFGKRNVLTWGCDGTRVWSVKCTKGCLLRCNPASLRGLDGTSKQIRTGKGSCLLEKWRSRSRWWRLW